MAEILGIHHVTAIASEPQKNIDFYAGVLGLRLVKLTVNYDDPTTYHLYYGDGQGHPGTIMTFFPWPGAITGRIGTGQLTVTSFAVPQKSLHHWKVRLKEHGTSVQETRSEFDERYCPSLIKMDSNWSWSQRQTRIRSTCGVGVPCRLILPFAVFTTSRCRKLDMRGRPRC
jgi:catechol 2,3-dioxygenase-like lactoylglutathione lyase family enzyme